MSGVYIGVDGKARKIKGGYIGIDGVARKIKKGYIGDENGVARLCWVDSPFDPVFANNTWEEIAMACQLNAVPDSWAVGDQKPMTIDGVEYNIDIIGKNHDDYSDGSGKAPLTFQMHEHHKTTYDMHSAYNNSVGWNSSKMRTNNLVLVMKTLPTIVQNAIKKVNKLTTGGNNNTTLYTTEDTLFLLSEVEIFGTTTFSGGVAEGIQYEYYANGGSKIKMNTAHTGQLPWWTRSPNVSTSSLYGVVKNGELANEQATYYNTVAFAFCF